LAREVDQVDLAVRVVAPEGGRETVGCRGADDGAAVGRDIGAVGGNRRDPAAEAGDRGIALRGLPHGLCLDILVDELRRVGLADLLYGRMVDARAHVRYTPEGVVRDDVLHDGVERIDVCDGGRKLADRAFHIGVLREVCHSWFLQRVHQNPKCGSATLQFVEVCDLFNPEGGEGRHQPTFDTPADGCTLVFSSRGAL